MNLKIIIITFTILLAQTGFAIKLKKIAVLETNNNPSFLYNSQFVYKSLDINYLKKLKKYVEKKGFKGNNKSELDFIYSALSWVTKQWKHDGMNQPPSGYSALDILKDVYDKEKRYRCVEYGLVLSEVLGAYGYVTRSLALRSNNVAYGGFGQGHVAMEVWSDSLSKWIFLDPQFGVYLTNKSKKEPLNYYDVFLEKKNKKWDSLKINFVVPPVKSKKEASADYKGFLQSYFGHISVSSGKGSPNISLLLEAKKQVLTFQGQPLSNAIFTKDHKLVYLEINRANALINYRDKKRNFQKVAEKHKIKTDKDYLKKMHLFSVEPNFKVKLQNNMPNFSHYEYKTNNSWTKIKDNQFDWSLKSGLNIIRIRAINKFKKSGPETYYKIGYN